MRWILKNLDMVRPVYVDNKNILFYNMNLQDYNVEEAH